MKENPNNNNGNRSPRDNNDKNNRDEFQWKKGGRSTLFWAVLIMAILLFSILFPIGGDNSDEIDYYEFLEHLEARNIEKGEVVVKDGANEFIGYLKPYARRGEEPEKFKTTLPPEYVTKEVIADWTKFVLIDESFRQMRSRNIPGNLLTEISGMKNRGYTTKSEFFEALNVYSRTLENYTNRNYNGYELTDWILSGGVVLGEVPSRVLTDLRSLRNKKFSDIKEFEKEVKDAIRQKENKEKYTAIITEYADVKNHSRMMKDIIAGHARGIDIEFKEVSTEFMETLMGILPWILLLGFWIFLFRRMQGGGTGKNIFSFGKSRARMMMENETRVTFDDVAGCDEAKEELQEIIEFLKNPGKFTKLGGKIPKGALLLGSPGTGKTLLARAVAGEAGVPFFSMSGADFVEMFVGVGASRVRDLFEQGRKHAPCIIFIDEMDAVGRQRGAGLGGGHDEREQTLNALLVEMDGFDTAEGVIILAATNRPDVLDAALLRPGRFDRQIVVDRPDVRGREGILRVHTKKIPLADDVDLYVIAKGTPGLAGANLANLVNEATLFAARNDQDKVTMEDFEMAKDKIMMGMERKSMIMSDEEKRSVAYHEAGHALVAKLIPGSDPVHKVTIIPRGRALGVTHYLPSDENHNYSKTYLEIRLCAAMGGRVAEKIVLGHLTTGAHGDIETATEYARKMVTKWGMSKKMGPISYGKKQEEIFLGREIATHRDYSEKTAQEIDAEVHRIIVEAEEKTEKLLTKNIDKLHALTEALLEREILDSEEIDLVLAGKPLPPLAAGRRYATLKAPKNGSVKGKSSAKPKKKIDDEQEEDTTEN